MLGLLPTTEPRFNSFTRGINRCIPGHNIRAGPFPPKAQLVAGHRWGPPLCVGPVRRSGRLDLWPVRRTASGPTIPSVHGIREGVTMYSTHLCVFLVAFRITYFLTSVIHLYREPAHRFSIFAVRFSLNLTFTIIVCHSHCRAVNAASPRIFWSLRHEIYDFMILCNTLTCQEVQLGAIRNVSVCKQTPPETSLQVHNRMTTSFGGRGCTMFRALFGQKQQQFFPYFQ